MNGITARNADPSTGSAGSEDLSLPASNGIAKFMAGSNSVRPDPDRPGGGEPGDPRAETGSKSPTVDDQNIGGPASIANTNRGAPQPQEQTWDRIK